MTVGLAKRGPPRSVQWDVGIIPPILRPIIRAYALGYASAVAPRILTLLVQHLSSRGRRRRAMAAKSQAQATPFVESLLRILRGGLDLQRFPTFCAALVGGSTLLQVPLNRLIARSLRSLSDLARIRLSRWLASFIAAWFSLWLLQSKQTPGFTDVSLAGSDFPPGVRRDTVRYAGRTLDLSLFAATRAMDVIVGEAWSRRRHRRTEAGKWTPVEAFLSKATDPTIFAASCAAIMWAWIYVPTRLPGGYNKWIGAAAAVDPRLLEALRGCRTGEVRYGQDTGQAHLLQAMCLDYSWPPAWGDPKVSIPFPCEMVHMGCGPSCEKHALSRFYRSWRWSMATYLPLSLLLVVRNPSVKSLLRASLSASRSSAFLGAFIAFFYYGVCLARTRLGPRLLGRDVISRQLIDGGVCVGSGCFLCGWSILIENVRRQKDMALFVAPRALATLFPRRYGLDKQWRETLVFATSTAVVFTCVLENQGRVRGVLGKVLASVLKIEN